MLLLTKGIKGAYALCEAALLLAKEFFVHRCIGLYMRGSGSWWRFGAVRGEESRRGQVAYGEFRRRGGYREAATAPWLSLADASARGMRLMREHSAISAHIDYSDSGTAFRNESFVFCRLQSGGRYRRSMLLPALTADGVGFRVCDGWVLPCLQRATT